MDLIFNQGDEQFLFVAKRFILDGRTVTAVEALTDPELLGRLVEMKAGVIQKIGKLERSGSERQQNDVTSKPSSTEGVQVAAAIQQVKDGVKSELVTKAWADYHSAKLERKKLSSETFRMVERNASTAELKAHYKNIMDLQATEKTLFDRAKIIEEKGALPEAAETVTVEGLKDRRRKLVDLRCKLSKKISNAMAAKNGKPHKMAEWQLEFDMANAEYDQVNSKILSFSPNAKA